MEAPLLEWKCSPVPGTTELPGVGLPEEVQIMARHGAESLKPFYLSGECILRLGLDVSATLVCNELTSSLGGKFQGTGIDWDRLAEI